MIQLQHVSHIFTRRNKKQKTILHIFSIANKSQLIACKNERKSNSILLIPSCSYDSIIFAEYESTRYKIEKKHVMK